MSAARLICACLLACLWGCSSKLTEAWEVKEPRLIAARVEVVGDSEARSRPRLGEAFRVRVFLAAPRPPTAYSVGLTACLALQSSVGEAQCLAEMAVGDLRVAYNGRDELVLEADTFVFTPEILAVANQVDARASLAPGLDVSAHITLIGSACAEGTAERVPKTDATKDPKSTLYRCVGNDGAAFKDPMPFTFSVLLDRGDPNELNHRPSFACTDDVGACAEGVPDTDGEGVPGSVVITLPDADKTAHTVLWPELLDGAELPWTECQGQAAFPEAYGGEHHVIRIRFDPSDRETYDRKLKENAGVVTRTQREDLVVSHAFTSHGDAKLSGFNSLVARVTPDPLAEAVFEYDAPLQSEDLAKHIPSTGKLVRFFFAVRDQRGGVDFTTRALCLLPPRP